MSTVTYNEQNKCLQGCKQRTSDLL